MPHQVLQSSTSGFYVFADDAEQFGDGLTGLSISVSLSKAGGPFLSVAPTVTDLGGGVYWIAPIAAHRDTLGEIAWRFTAAGAVISPRFERVGVVNDQLAAWGANTTAPDNAGINVARTAATAAAGLLDELTEQNGGGVRFAAKALELAEVDLQPVNDEIAAVRTAAEAAAGLLAGLTELDGDQLRLTAKALELADVNLQPVLDAIASLPTAPSNLAVSIASLLSALSIRRLTERQPLVTDVMLVRGTDWRIPITVDGLPDDWTRIELTARRHNSDAQSQSLLHIVLSHPAADNDGLQILAGSPAADRAAGAITVTDGQAIATVSAAAVAAVADGEFCWDCKVTSAAGIEQVARGTLFVERDVTRLAAA